MSPELAVSEKAPLVQLVKRLDVLPNDYSPYEILKNSLRGKRWESIRTADIQMDVVINDEHHVQDLSRSIFGENQMDGLGQISPTNNAAFLDDNDQIYYLITDGFHRTDAFIRAGAANIESIVLYGLTLEEVFDLRVLAANSVKSTGFARVIEFMGKSFEQTYWHQHKGLTLLQTFSLCVQNTSGIKLQLTPQESKALKSWVWEKSRIWGRTPGSIFQMLLIASKADPELVRKVRRGARGRGDGSGDFNTASLKAMTEIIPDKHELQWIVYEAVVQNDLVEEETRSFSRLVSYFDNHEQPDLIELACSKAKVVVEIAKHIVEPEVIKDILLVAEYHDLDQAETISLAGELKNINDDYLKDQMFQNPKKFIKTTSATAGKAVNKNGLINQPAGKRHQGVLDKMTYSGPETTDKTAGYAVNHTNLELEEKISRLEEELAKLQEVKGGVSWKRRKRTWWKSIPNLSVEEQKIFSLIFLEGYKISKTAKTLNLTDNQIAKFIYSGVNKYILQEREKLLDSVCKYIFFDPDNKEKDKKEK